MRRDTSVTAVTPLSTQREVSSACITTLKASRKPSSSILPRDNLRRWIRLIKKFDLIIFAHPQTTAELNVLPLPIYPGEVAATLAPDDAAPCFFLLLLLAKVEKTKLKPGADLDSHFRKLFPYSFIFRGNCRK